MPRNIWQGKNGPLLIAEIGGNHEGDFAYAERLNRLAIGAGVDYVKHQLYRGDTLVSRLEDPTRNQHFMRFELLEEQHKTLAAMCRENGVGYLASVWDMNFIDWIDEYMDFFKVGSGDLTAYPVLKKLASKGKPILLSSGLSTLDEVLEAVAYLQSLDSRYREPENLALLQCTAMYPIVAADANLSVMNTLREKTGLPVGYSDHTEGMYALEVAVAMGAQILEFHFTDDREGKVFRDHKVSLTADEVRDLQKRITRIRELQGDSVKRPLDSEKEHRISFRRAVYPIVDIPAGTVITEEHLTVLRPNHGIDAREYNQVLNRQTLVDLKAHQRLEWSYFTDENGKDGNLG